MRPRSSFKQDFLKKWMQGLLFYASSTSSSSSSNSNNNMVSFLERKNIIELSADVAMASARDGKTCWSRALIASSMKQNENKGLVKNILGSDDFERYQTLLKPSSSSVGKSSSSSTFMCNNKRVKSKKILRRSCFSKRKASYNKSNSRRSSIVARSIAKRMVEKRTQVLKGLIPGGESMDNESGLLEETLDYILSLQAKVDVMRQLVRVSERLIHVSTTTSAADAAATATVTATADDVQAKLSN